jgi:hypothetical protein
MKKKISIDAHVIGGVLNIFGNIRGFLKVL